MPKKSKKIESSDDEEYIITEDEIVEDNEINEDDEEDDNDEDEDEDDEDDDDDDDDDDEDKQSDDNASNSNVFIKTKSKKKIEVVVDSEINAEVVTSSENPETYIINMLKQDSLLNLNKNVLNIKQTYLLNNDRISKNFMTKYEMVRILGERIKQLTMGAKPLVKTSNMSYEEIAEAELKLNVIPFKIVRPLPIGSAESSNVSELWSIDELYKEHLYLQT